MKIESWHKYRDTYRIVKGAYRFSPNLYVFTLIIKNKPDFFYRKTQTKVIIYMYLDRLW